MTSSIKICIYRNDMLILSYSVLKKFCPQTELTVLRILYKRYYHYLTIVSEWICSTFLTSNSQMKDFPAGMLSPTDIDRVNPLDDISNPSERRLLWVPWCLVNIRILQNWKSDPTQNCIHISRLQFTFVNCRLMYIPTLFSLKIFYFSIILLNFFATLL